MDKVLQAVNTITIVTLNKLEMFGHFRSNNHLSHCHSLFRDFPLWMNLKKLATDRNP
jgi:hypothetical protein